MSDDLDLVDAAAVLEDYFGTLGAPWRWQWREVPFGPCPRCRWPAHTLAPNGVSFHPFCWGNPEPVPAWSDWVRRKDGIGEWGNRTREPAERDNGDRQWCAKEGAWFEPTPERLALCVDHAAEVVARWR